jgi:hypothetical protein
MRLVEHTLQMEVKATLHNGITAMVGVEHTLQMEVKATRRRVVVYDLWLNIPYNNI